MMRPRAWPRANGWAWAAAAAGALFLAGAWLVDFGGTATAETPTPSASISSATTTPSPSATGTGTGTAVATATTAPTVSSGSCALAISDQAADASGDAVTVARARMAERGYVVIEEYDESRGFGPALGSAPLAAGVEAESFRVQLNCDLVVGERLWAELYAETTGDDAFEPPFAGAFDQPLVTSACANPAFVNPVLGGGYAMFPFRVLAGTVTPAAPATGGGTAQPRTSGWALFAFAGIGTAALLAGAGVAAGRRRCRPRSER